MSQFAVTNGSINATEPTNTKDKVDRVQKETPAKVHNQSQVNQPNVRHIPIFVEGRDEPLFNKNVDVVDAPVTRPAPVLNDIPQTETIFSRVKNIPVKKIIPDYQASNFGRSASPGRTIPINVVHTQTNKKSGGVQNTAEQEANQPAKQPQVHQQQQSQPINVQASDRRSQSPKPPPVDPIEKIQNIQKEILELMNKVEKFKGGSRKDKGYMYLDEMLTQNLLKLDTIDTEGKENIKAARKEAINCINKCIQVLEAKAENSDCSHNEKSPAEDASDGSKQESDVKESDNPDNKRNTEIIQGKNTHEIVKEKSPSQSST